MMTPKECTQETNSDVTLKSPHTGHTNPDTTAACTIAIQSLRETLISALKVILPGFIGSRCLRRQKQVGLCELRPA